MTWREKQDDHLAAVSGIRVLDISQGMAGQLGAMILADNGADVVKIEKSGGDPLRRTPGYRMWNRGKQSIELDLRDRTDDGRLAAALAREADVLISDQEPGTLDAFGLTYSQIAPENPGLIACEVSGYGPGERPAGARAATEGIVAASIGLFNDLDHLSGAIEGQDRKEPIFRAAPIGSYGAAQLACQGILAALIARDRYGFGARVQTSLAQGASAFLMREEMARTDSASEGRMSEVMHRGIELCFMTAECRDGRYIQMCARQDRHFHSFLEAVGLGELLKTDLYKGAPMHLARLADVEALDVLIRARMRDRTQSEWMTIFMEEFDVGADPFLTPHEFLAQADMIENGRIVTLDDPELGPISQVGALALLSETPSVITRPAPNPGQHAESIRAGVSSTDRTIPTGSVIPPSRRAPLLDGVTVLEVAYFIAGPLAGTMLRELGARVIKVEPIDGDPYRRTGLQSAKFLHGKESIAINLKDPSGVEILHKLARQSDVLLHSFRPGVPERLGLDYETIHQINPRLVYVYAASYGSRGPQRNRTAFHSTPTALCGGGILQAGYGNPPADDSYPDPGSALAVATAALLGLNARTRSNAGQYVETTMLTSTGYILSNSLVRPPDSSDLELPDSGQHGFGPLYRLYEGSDDRWLFLSASRDEEWPRLVDCLDYRDLLEDPRFRTPSERRQSAALAEILESVFHKRTVRDWVDRCTSAGINAVAVFGGTVPDWLETNNLLYASEHPMFGKYWCPKQRVNVEGVQAPRDSAAAIGEHTRPLLEEAGYDPSDIERLVSTGAVAEPDARAG